MSMLKMGSWLFFFSVGFLQATVNLQPETTEVYSRGACQRAGQIAFRVEADAFFEVASVGPIYVRLRLDHAAKLCETLVWSHPDNQNAASFQRLFLPLHLLDGENADRLVAPPETLSIVRWKKGETDIWFKVEEPTRDWVQLADGSMVPPSETLRVQWLLGLTARQDFELHQPRHQAGKANLPSATRNPADATSAAAVSTLFCVDLSGSNLEPLPAGPELSNLNVDPVGFYTGVASGPGSVEESFGQNGIFLGSGSQVPFSHTEPVATANDADCEGIVLSDPGPVMAVNQQTPGLFQLTNQLGLQLDCGNPWGVHRGSVVRLETGPAGDQGFRVAVNGNNLPRDYHEVDASVPPGTFVLLENEIQLLNAAHAPPRGRVGDLFQTPDGAYLCRSGELVYTGTGTTAPIAWTIQATVSQWDMAEPNPVRLTLGVEASNRDDTADTPPFTGGEQRAFCDPSLKTAFQYDWNFGAFPVTVPTISGWSLLVLIMLLTAIAPIVARRRSPVEKTTGN